MEGAAYMEILQWMKVNWYCAIPLGMALVWAVCTFVECGACNRAGKPLPDKRKFPRRILVLQGLSTFFYLLWDCCGQLFWQFGWRTILLAACAAFLILLIIASLQAWRLVRRLVRPAAVARGFYLRRWMGSAIAGWIWGLFPAAVLQSVGQGGVDGAIRDLMRLFLPMTLPLLFLWAVWIFSRPWNGQSLTEEEPKETFSDRMIKLQIIDLIQEGIRQEEEENERRYREYWGDE